MNFSGFVPHRAVQVDLGDAEGIPLPLKLIFNQIFQPFLGLGWSLGVGFIDYFTFLSGMVLLFYYVDINSAEFGTLAKF